MFRVPAFGGDSKQLTQAAEGASHKFPEILPGGQRVLFAVHHGVGGEPRVELLDLVDPDGSRRVVLENALHPRFVPTGHILFGRPAGNQTATLLAATFDPSQPDAVGPPTPVVELLQANFPGNGTVQYDVSDEGDLVYEPPIPLVPPDLEVVLVDREGRAEPIGMPLGAFGSPRFSPDGERLALIDHAVVPPQIVLWDGRLTQVTTDGGASATWLPRSDSLAFGADSAEGRNVWRKPTRGGDAEQLTTGINMIPTHASADGKSILIQGQGDENDWDVLVLSLDDGDVVSLLQSPHNETQPQFSPDGQWIAYRSDELGGTGFQVGAEVFVTPVQEPASYAQVSSGGGSDPRWPPNSGELFYVGRNPRALMAVTITTEPRLQLGEPRALFELDGYRGSWDVSPDGERFVMFRATSAEPPTRDRLILVRNWFEELKQRVPTGR